MLLDLVYIWTYWIDTSTLHILRQLQSGDPTLRCCGTLGLNPTSATGTTEAAGLGTLSAFPCLRPVRQTPISPAWSSWMSGSAVWTLRTKCNQHATITPADESKGLFPEEAPALRKSFAANDPRFGGDHRSCRLHGRAMQPMRAMDKCKVERKGVLRRANVPPNLPQASWG